MRSLKGILAAPSTIGLKKGGSLHLRRLECRYTLCCVIDMIQISVRGKGHESLVISWRYTSWMRNCYQSDFKTIKLAVNYSSNCKPH